jgi:hypothetical protein
VSGKVSHVHGVAFKDCKPCNAARNKAWREANPEKLAYIKGTWDKAHPEKVALYNKRWRLKREYGMTIADKEALFEETDGLCAICLEEPATHIDHDHATGVVRGALCRRCNQGLGIFDDDPERLRDAASYLEVVIRPKVG